MPGNRVIWSALVLAAIVGSTGVLLARRDARDASTSPARLPYHLVDHLDLLPVLSSPLCGRRTEPQTPAQVLEFSELGSVAAREAGGLALRHVAHDELSKSACVEVKASPRGRARVSFTLGTGDGGYVEIEGRVRIHTEMRGEDLARTMREVRRLPQAWLRVFPLATAAGNGAARLDAVVEETPPTGTTLLPGEGSIGIKNFAAWQPFNVPVRLPEGTRQVQVELLCDIPFGELRFDDLAARPVSPIALIEDLGRYRYAPQTEVTAPILKMIRSGNEDRLSLLFLPGSKLSFAVQLEPGSHLELNATWVVPESLSGPFDGSQELLVRAHAGDGTELTAHHVLAHDDARLHAQFVPLALDLSALGAQVAEITLESPALVHNTIFEPPFLCLGDPLVLAPRPADGRPAGVIVLTLDALSRNHTSAGGYRRHTTPTLDQLVSEGAFFVHAMAPTPSTYTSLPSFLSSSHRRDSWQEFLANLDAESQTLPEVFGAQGFRSAVFIRDIYFNSFWKGVNVRPYPYTRPKLTTEEIDYEMTDRLIAWLQSVRDQHFFVWMHLNQPHGPNRPSPPHDLFRNDADAAPSFAAIQAFMTTTGVPGAKGLAETAEQVSLHRENHDAALVRHAEVVIEALYDASIHEADALVARVVAALRSDALLDQTLLVIASDHGWPLVPVFHPEAKGADAEYEVPLILRGPGVPAQQRISERVSLVDLGPTLLDLAHLEPAPSFEGRSLRPLLQGGTLGLRLVASQKKEEFLGYLGAAKIVVPRASITLPEDEALRTATFFDLGLDPESLKPIPAASEPLARQAYRALVTWHSAPRTAFRERKLTEGLQGFLREAGYLKDDKPVKKAAGSVEKDGK